MMVVWPMSGQWERSTNTTPPFSKTEEFGWKEPSRYSCVKASVLNAPARLQNFALSRASATQKGSDAPKEVMLLVLLLRPPHGA